MKKYLLTLPLSILMSLALSAQASRGSVVEDITLKSNILKKDMQLNIYLPPNYTSSSQHYPVLYLLHGMDQNYKDWVQKEKADSITNPAIET